MVYFRAGYSPDDYPTQAEWDARCGAYAADKRCEKQAGCCLLSILLPPVLTAICCWVEQRLQQQTQVLMAAVP